VGPVGVSATFSGAFWSSLILASRSGFLDFSFPKDSNLDPKGTLRELKQNQGQVWEPFWLGGAKKSPFF
jgi:hypothetical protein